MFSSWLGRADNMVGRQSPAVKRHTLLQNNNNGVSSRRKQFDTVAIIQPIWICVCFLKVKLSLIFQTHFNPENPLEANRCHFCPPVCKGGHGQVSKYFPSIKWFAQNSPFFRSGHIEYNTLYASNEEEVIILLIKLLHLKENGVVSKSDWFLIKSAH